MKSVSPNYVTPNHVSRVPVKPLGWLTACSRDSATPSSATRGFSLLEMIVATTVLSLAIVGLLGVVRTSLANASRVKEYDRAAMLARSTMSEIQVRDPIQIPGRLAGRYDDKAGWEAVIKPFELPIRPRSGGVVVVHIHLTVWWRSEGRRKTQVFDGFRRVRITPDHMRLAAFQ